MLTANLIAGIISDVFLYLFTWQFIKSRFSLKKQLSVYVLSFLSITALYVLIQKYPFSSVIIPYLLYGIGILIYIGSIYYTAKKRSVKTVFLTITGTNYALVGEVIFVLSMHYLDNNLWLSALLEIIVLSLVLWIIVKAIRRTFDMLLRERYTTAWYLCFVPIMFYCCLRSMLSGQRFLSYGGFGVLPVCLFLLLEVVAYAFTFMNLGNREEKKYMQWQNDLLASYVQGMKSQYENVVESEAKIRRIRHDYRHYVALLQDLLNNQEYEEIKKVLGNLDAQMDESKVVRYCDNVVVNSILHSYIQKAEREKIKVSASVVFPADVDEENSMNSASVIANLLENAIYATKELAEEKRYIKLIVRHTKEHYWLEIKNPCEGKVNFDTFTRLPISDKGEGHGIGLESVAFFSEKMGSQFDCHVENNEFIVQILHHFEAKETKTAKAV